MAFTVGDFSGYWQAFSRNLHGPQPRFFGSLDFLLCRCFENLEPNGRVAEVKMFSAAFAGVRSAMVLSLGGGAMHVPTVLRLSLESTAYGALFGAKPEWYQVWRDRHEDATSKQKFRNSGLTEARGSLEQLGTGFKKNFDALYQMLIDIGAHPNVLGIDGFVQASELDASTDYYTFQHLSSHFDRLLSFHALGQVSVFLINVIINSWPDKLKNQENALVVFKLTEQLEALDVEISRLEGAQSG